VEDQAGVVVATACRLAGPPAAARRPEAKECGHGPSPPPREFRHFAADSPTLRPGSTEGSEVGMRVAASRPHDEPRSLRPPVGAQPVLDTTSVRSVLPDEPATNSPTGHPPDVVSRSSGSSTLSRPTTSTRRRRDATAPPPRSNPTPRRRSGRGATQGPMRRLATRSRRTAARRVPSRGSPLLAGGTRAEPHGPHAPVRGRRCRRPLRLPRSPSSLAFLARLPRSPSSPAFLALTFPDRTRQDPAATHDT
jgi:hypothetical protein